MCKYYLKLFYFWKKFCYYNFIFVIYLKNIMFIVIIIILF